jgi:hypothetical protein
MAQGAQQRDARKSGGPYLAVQAQAHPSPVRQLLSSRERRYCRCSDPELSPRAGLGRAAIISATLLSAAGHRVRRPPAVGERPVHRAHEAVSCPLRASSRRTAIRVSPRSRTLASSPCSAGWSVSRPKMTVSSPSPQTCRPSNQAAHRLSRTPATRISYRAGPPEAVTLAPQSCGQEWPSPRQPPAAADGGAGHGLSPAALSGMHRRLPVSRGPSMLVSRPAARPGRGVPGWTV